MIDKKKVLFVASRVFFMGVFFVVSIGFVVWEANGLVNWNTDSNPTKVEMVKAAEKSDAVVLGESSQEENKQTSSAVVAADARPEILRQYLEKFKSPLAPYSDLIFDLSQKYGYDYRWIVAIARQESGLCKVIPENSHNCWGYGIHKKGTLRFDSYELAINSYADYLKREYFDKGLDTPEKIMKKYCPSSNGSWAAGVQHFMDEMENGDF